MKRCLTALLSLLLAASACAAQTAAQSPRLGREFKVKVGWVLQLDRGRLMLRFARVASDSRCPKDVDCVWAGNAEVVVEVGGRLWRDKQALTLSTNAVAQGASEARYGRYTVRLVALSPQPRSRRNQTAAQYTATLLVSKE
jgi:hypothetical protein